MTTTPNENPVPPGPAIFGLIIACGIGLAVIFLCW